MGCQFASSQKVDEPHKLTIRQQRSKIIDSRRQSTKLMDTVTENVKIIRNQLERVQSKFAFKCLAEHEFFSTLKQQQIQQIIRSMVLAQAKQGEYVFREGDPGNSFFIVYTGQVDVQIDSTFIRKLGQGKSFGEVALLFKTQRTASIKCKAKNNIFLVMKPALFRESLKKMKIYEFEKNKKMIDGVQIFRGLTNKQKQMLSQNLKTIYFAKDEVIFNEGDPAKTFYIISSGQVKIDIPGKQSLTLKTFQSFGEGAFKSDSKRAGKSVATTDSVCCFLKKNDLDNIFGRKFDNIFYFNLKKWALIRSETLQLDSHAVGIIISKFQIKRAEQGEILVENSPTGIIINLQGLMNGKPEGTLFCQKNYLDRTALCNPIIKNDIGNYAYLSFEDLDRIKRQILDSKSQIMFSKKTIPSQKQNADPFNLCKFHFIKQLGQGQFGKVYLVRNNEFGGNLYAVKCLSKQQIRKQAMQKCVVQQKRILSKIIFPYIVGFAQAFQDHKNIYFLMEYIKGKQMFDVIREMPVLTKKIAVYFFSCLLISVEHLHLHNIIYRDIKPQNSVVDFTGKAFLIDLGTAKVLKKQSFYKTFTMIGTPHYMAPQILDGKGYSFEVDIWSLGVLLYEFVCGSLPFGEHQNDPYVVMKKVRTQQIKYGATLSIPQNLKDLLSLLMQKNPKVRSIKATFQKIKQSSYLQDMNWSDLLHQRTKPAYVPKDFRKQVDHQNTLKLEGKPFGEFLYGKSVFNKQWIVKDWNEDFIK